ncbi:hypothetical protein ACFL6U_20145 [Planctomycetota bacterium]
MTLINGQSSTVPKSIEEAAAGQKLIICAILINYITIGLQLIIGNIAGLLGIVAIAMALVGFFSLASALGYSTGVKIGLTILLLVPLVGLITLLVLNSKATKVLRKAGYKVGLLGAKR